MTPAQFAAVLQANTRIEPDSRSTRAARLVLVDGMSRNKASREAGCSLKVAAQAAKRIQELASPAVTA